MSNEGRKDLDRELEADVGDAHGHVHVIGEAENDGPTTDITGHEVGTRDTSPKPGQKPADLSEEEINRRERDAQVNPHGAQTGAGIPGKKTVGNHEKDWEADKTGQLGNPGAQAKNTKDAGDGPAEKVPDAPERG